MASLIDQQSALPVILELLNKKPPIVKSQFEIWYSQWPEIRWLSQGITVPGLTSKTADVAFNGFSVPLIINTTYDNYVVEMEIIADEGGTYYKAWRDLVILHSRESGTLPDGETQAMMKGRPMILHNSINCDLVVKCCNPGGSNLDNKAGHFWRIHDFKPTQIGEMQWAQTDTDLATFIVTGIFTYINYTNDEADRGVLSSTSHHTQYVNRNPAPWEPSLGMNYRPFTSTWKAPPHNGKYRAFTPPPWPLPVPSVEQQNAMGQADALARQMEAEQQPITPETARALFGSAASANPMR